VVRVRLDDRFTYRPGQAAQIGPAAGSVLVPYSMASAPEDTERDGCLEFLIRIDSGGRWGEQFAPLRRGQQITVKGPVGGFAFPDHPAEHRFLFIAGGTGVSPIRSMIRHVHASVRGRTRLLYSARTPLDFAYRQELAGMARRGEIDILLTATRDVASSWRGGRGRISQSQLAGLVDDPATLCFVCGPASMVDDVPRMLRELGIDGARIRIEEW
jgi:ferredoxin-NADP reductase